MFAKTVDGVYVNLLGADTITRQDHNNGTSRLIVRHGGIVTEFSAMAIDKPGSPRREAFEIVERFIDTMKLVPESMSATMLLAPKKAVKEKVTVSVEEGQELLNEALSRIEDLEEQLVEARHSLANSRDNLRYADGQAVTTRAEINKLQSELRPYRQSIQERIDACKGSDPGDDPDNVGH